MGNVKFNSQSNLEFRVPATFRRRFHDPFETDLLSLSLSQKGSQLKVMLDTKFGGFYGVETKRLNEQVKKKH